MEGRQPWKVSWKKLSSNLITKQLPVTATQTGDQHIVTREIRVIKPTKANHGSVIRCDASPTYGTPIRKTIHLHIAGNYLYNIVYSSYMPIWAFFVEKVSNFTICRACSKLLLGCFSSKARTSLKMQIFVSFWSLQIFKPFHSQKAAHRQKKIPQIGLHSRISIAYEYAHTVFSFPSRRSLPEGRRPSKYSFQVFSFRKRIYSTSLETCKSFEVDFTL